jgi:alpha-1,2-mannosyltransferase
VPHPGASTTSFSITGTSPNARLAGLSSAGAYAVQAIATLGAVAAVVWTFWRRREPLLSYSLLLVATLIATPYLISYDLVVVGWMVLGLYNATQLLPRERVLFVALYWLPFIALATAAGIPGSALIPLAATLMLFQALRNREEAASAGALDSRGEQGITVH